MKINRIILAAGISIAILAGGFVVYALNNQDATFSVSDDEQKRCEYPVNSSGQTYGSSQYAFSIESLPDLIHGGSVNGVDIYIYTKDVLEAMPKTPEQARDGSYLETIFPMYKEDGKTVVGSEGYYFGIQFLPAAVISEYAIPPYLVNKNGQTYGTLAGVGPNNPVEPDLIAAVGIDDTTVGYVYKTDLEEDQPNNPDEALEYMRRREERHAEMITTGEKYIRIIPLYAEDGETVIGEFGIG